MQSVVPSFCNWRCVWVWHCSTLIGGSLCMLYKIRCNPLHPLHGALPGPYVPVRLHAVLWSHLCALMHRLAAELRSTAWLLFPSQCPSGTILLTPYSMVWDWRISRAGPMLFYWPSCSIPTIVFYYFSLSLFSVYSICWYCGAGVFGLLGCISWFKE